MCGGMFSNYLLLNMLTKKNFENRPMFDEVETIFGAG